MMFYLNADVHVLVAAATNCKQCLVSTFQWEGVDPFTFSATPPRSLRRYIYKVGQKVTPFWYSVFFC